MPRSGRSSTAVQREEPYVIEQQMRLCEIPAPPFGESARAAAYKQAFERLGLTNVRIDGAGNVLGDRAGLSPRPHLVLSAHLDTVFPADTRVTPTRSGSVLSGPGIADDCRGLAVLLGVIRALNTARMQTTGSITFVGTVGEEGLGDLRGVKHLFESRMPGAGRSLRLDRRRRSRHYRHGGRQPPVPGHVQGARRSQLRGFRRRQSSARVGRAVGRIADLQVPREPRTTFNVGRVGGGTSVNSIAVLRLDGGGYAVDRSAQRSARSMPGFRRRSTRHWPTRTLRWDNRGRLTVEKALVGSRPGGSNPADAPIVTAAVSVTSALGRRTSVDEGSTDANIPMSLGIPAITIGGGGASNGTHTTTETFETTDSWQGTARAILLAIALTGR